MKDKVVLVDGENYKIFAEVDEQGTVTLWTDKLDRQQERWRFDEDSGGVMLQASDAKKLLDFLMRHKERFSDG